MIQHFVCFVHLGHPALQMQLQTKHENASQIGLTIVMHQGTILDAQQKNTSTHRTSSINKAMAVMRITALARRH